MFIQPWHARARARTYALIELRSLSLSLSFLFPCFSLSLFRSLPPPLLPRLAFSFRRIVTHSKTALMSPGNILSSRFLTKFNDEFSGHTYVRDTSLDSMIMRSRATTQWNVRIMCARAREVRAAAKTEGSILTININAPYIKIIITIIIAILISVLIVNKNI